MCYYKGDSGQIAYNKICEIRAWGEIFAKKFQRDPKKLGLNGAKAFCWITLMGKFYIGLQRDPIK